MPVAVPSNSVSSPTHGSEHAAPNFHGSAARVFAFGEFLLRPEQQSLVRQETPVRIGGRALDILTVLVERPGELVDKRTLMVRVWPETYVEETNLKVNVAGLRRVLGDDPARPTYIATVVGRGYRFVAPVHFTGHLTEPRAFALEGRPAGAEPSIHELLKTIDAVRRRLAQLSPPGG
jgi:DNA-binding winged helix-turn-helix (wHTH) protein